jgi:uncharacterized membrane protein YhaH (DUF805 family)
VPIWLKPFKFSVSLTIYLVTLAWLLSLNQRRQRRGWWLGNAIAAAAVIEMVVIVGQVIRGHSSHFNVGTALDATLWGVMAVFTVVLWLATLGTAVLLLRQRIADRPTTLAIRLGLLIALGGAALGLLMVSPTAEQLAGMETAAPTVVGAHSVGVQDGGPGLPLVNWSTTGGDLRIGHFVGMHALQALPLLALGLSLAARRFSRLRDERTRVRLVMVGALAIVGLVVLVTSQALRAQPLIHPDAWTLMGAAVLAAVTAGGALRAMAGGTVTGTRAERPAGADRAASEVHQ